MPNLVTLSVLPQTISLVLIVKDGIKVIPSAEHVMLEEIPPLMYQNSCSNTQATQGIIRTITVTELTECCQRVDEINKKTIL